MRTYVFDEMTKFEEGRDFETIDRSVIAAFEDRPVLHAFLQSLAEPRIAELCEWLSNWRRNGAWHHIAGHPTAWSEQDVDVSRIRIGGIRPEIDKLLHRHNRELERIAQDKEISEHWEFRGSGGRTTWFLAKADGNNFRIVDGSHRIVRMACDGARSFKLVCPQTRADTQLH